MGQLSIYDITGDRPAPTLRVHFKNFYGMPEIIDIGLRDDNPKTIAEAVARCRQDHKKLFFQFYEVIT